MYATALRFSKDVRAIALDLFFDPLSSNPSLVATKDTLFQMKNLLGPLLLRYFEVIHIPRIAGNDGTKEFCIEDLILYGKDILPDHISVRSSSEGDLHFLKRKKGGCKNFITVEIKHWGLHAHRFKYFFHQLTGFKIQDEGIANFDISGRHNFLTMVWKVKSKNGIVKFSMKDVICHIEKVKLKLIQTNHRILAGLGVGMAKGTIKKNLEKAIVNGVAGWMTNFNNRMNMCCATPGLLPTKQTKYEKGAYGIPEDYGAPSRSQTYVASDVQGSRFGVVKY